MHINKLEENTEYLAFKKAWEIRNFEIEMYWTRAKYFWAFITSAFAGYFGILNLEGQNHSLEFLLIIIGLLLSLAWHFGNLGSKKWQENWENHIDLREDQFTGSLYKTIFVEKGFSISKINECVSGFFIVVWILLLGRFFALSFFSSTLSLPLNPYFKYFLYLVLMVFLLAALLWCKNYCYTEYTKTKSVKKHTRETKVQE